MTPTEKTRLLRGFYNQLEDRPLERHDPVYVPLREGKPNDPIAMLATQIGFREAAGVNLLSGQMGSGKSTELRRLDAVLDAQGYVVFFSDMRQYMNMSSSVEITDFLISLMAALADQLEARFGSDLRKEEPWTRFLNFLRTEVDLQEVGVEKGITLRAALTSDPSFKRRLQDHFRFHVTRLVKEAKDFADAVVGHVRDVRGEPDLRVVFIVDSLEQIRGVGADADEVYRSLENVFSVHADALRFRLLDVVYTVPQWLIPRAPNVGRKLGSGVHSLPVIHVYQHRSRDPDPQGLAIMREIVERRLRNWETVFLPHQIDRMALSAGGDLRDFLYLLRFCLVSAGAAGADLPISDEIVTQSENDMRRSMLPISGEDVRWLRTIAESKNSQLDSIDALPSLSRFFDNKLVLNYRNGDDWYDVHPLIRDVVEADGPGDDGE